VIEAQKLGAGAYIKKPYVLEKIGLALREELDRPEAGPGHREGGQKRWSRRS
jgi:hypothetical protein